MDLEMKKNVLKNEYSIVIMIAFVIGLPFIIIWPEMVVERTTMSPRRLVSPHLFA